MKKRMLSVVLSLVMIVSLVTTIPVVSAEVIGDDYPYSVGPNEWYTDDWGFYQGECTSFVCWRMNNANKISFSNYYVNGERVHNDYDKVDDNGDGTRLGSAKYWGTALKSMGYTVDSTPQVGSIAWTPSGRYGHVAWVAAVNGSTVTIEEYNYPYAHKYNTRNVSTSDFQYIHLQDAIPSATGIDYGDDFYAYIITDPKSVDNTWIYLSATDNNSYDATNDTNYNDVKLAMENSDVDPKQIWHFKKQNNNNHYLITNEYDNRILSTCSTESWTDVQTWEKPKTEYQRWILKYVPDGGGRVFIYPVYASDKALDVRYGFYRGNSIQIYTANNTDAQMFYVYNLAWNPGYNYAVPTPEKPVITSAYTDENILNLKWTESASTSMFDTNRQYEVRIEDSNNSIVEWVNVGNVTGYSCTLPKQGKYTVKITAITVSYNTTAKYSEGTWATSEPRQVLYGVVPCASVTNENTYLLFDVDVNYESAKAYCESLGGHLATITTANEQKTIADLVLNGGASYYWLGGTDAGNEGTWKWTTGEDWTYSNWNDGEPNNDQGIENNITIIKQTGKWNDRPATVQNGFICEIEGCNHSNTELRNAVNATCCESGYTGDTYCTDCGEKIASGTVIPATGNHTDADGKWESDGSQHWHTCYYGTQFDVASHIGGTATCTAKAKCSVCGAEYGEYGAHGETEIRNAKDATCCEDGYTGDTYCKDCHTKIASGSVIPATGNHIDADGKWETNGIQHWHTCYYGTQFDVASHSGGTATCTEKAKCSVCGAEYGDYAAHTLTYHDRVEPDYENDGNIEYWTCDECGKYFSDAEGNNEISADDVIIAKLTISEYQFLDGEVIIEAPEGAIPEGSLFDVQKIVPPPAEVVEKVKDQMGASSEVLAYYEIRLSDTSGELIIHLDGEITIKVKMPEQYVGSKCVRILQEDETGKLIVMESWWENDYLCYKTDWLEIYN